MHTLRKDPRDARGILIRTSLLELFISNSGSSWQLFRLEQLLSGKLERECTNICDARPQQNSGKTPKRDTVQYFWRRPPGSRIGLLSNDKRRMVFEVANNLETRTTSAALSLSSEFDNNNFCTNRKQLYEGCTLLINSILELIIRMNSHKQGWIRLSKCRQWTFTKFAEKYYSQFNCKKYRPL